jgi:hypothetical protein
VALVVGAGDYIGSEISKRFDSGVDTAWVRGMLEQGGADLDRLPPDRLMNPTSIAEAYWNLHQQSRDAWTFELDLRPYEKMTLPASRRRLHERPETSE